MTSSQPVRRFDWNNLGIRAASAVVLIPAAVAMDRMPGPARASIRMRLCSVRLAISRSAR